MSIRKKLYDPIFESVLIREAVENDFDKKLPLDVALEGYDESLYITSSDLLNKFKISRHQLLKTIAAIGVEPIGVKTKIIDGKKASGSPEIVYESSIVEKIYDHIPTKEIKEIALQILGDDWDE